jgi:hypothetical protein
MYSQAMYIIFTALDLLPENAEVELRASLHIMMGNILKEFFIYNSNLIKTSNLEIRDPEEIAQLEKFINTKQLEFENNNVVFPTNKIYKNAKEITTLFKMSMTQYKKAGSTFVLDGFVTEHVQICKQQSELYKILANLEEKPGRKYAMGNKRSELITPLFQEISSKHYIGVWRVSLTLDNLD